jgi:hypothetical protein
MSFKLPGESIVTGVLDAGKYLIDRFVPDPEKKAQAELELFRYTQDNKLQWAQLDVQSDGQQRDVNVVEAASTDLFRAGWRPFIGWVCGSAFAFKFILFPVAFTISSAFGVPLAMPLMDWTELSIALFGMLGLGYMRTREKMTGVA